MPITTVESINLSTNEDESIIIQLSGSDPNNLDLSFSITNPILVLWKF